MQLSDFFPSTGTSYTHIYLLVCLGSRAESVVITFLEMKMQSLYILTYIGIHIVHTNSVTLELRKNS